MPPCGNLSVPLRSLTDMSNRHDTKQEKTPASERSRLSSREARTVFNDPVGYLRRHGIGAQVVETSKRPVAPAA